MTKSKALRLTYQAWLRQEFVNRCQRNPAYSIRAFAKFLGTDSSSLSQILTGKRRASDKLITRFTNAIGVDPETRAAVLADARRRQMRAFRSTAGAEEPAYFELAVDTFNVIADWYHYAILELSKMEGFRSEPRWIAKKLHLTMAETRTAIGRLLRLGLLKEADGRLIATEEQVTNAGSVETSHAMKKLQRHVLQKALQSIDNTPGEDHLRFATTNS